jgi:lipoprotein-releasing system permease protein
VNAERFIAARITHSNKGKSNISRPIVKIGIIGIALGISVMILTVAIVLGFKKEIITKITGITSHITISNIDVNNSNEPDPIKISEDTLKMITDDPGVEIIQSSSVKYGIVKTKSENAGVLLKGITKDYDLAFVQKKLVEGKAPSVTDTGVTKEILVSSVLADKLNLHLGQKLLVYFVTKKKLNDTTFGGSNYLEYEKRSRDFRVCGIYNTGFSEFDNNLAFVDLKHLQKLNYWGNNEVGAYEIKIKNFDDLAMQTERVQELLGYNYRVIPVDEEYSNIFSWLGMVDVNGIIIITLMLLVAGVNMITALLILILERANMIGLIKSLGMSNVKVRKVFMYVSMRLLWKGLLYGNLIGLGAVLLQYYFQFVKLDSEIYYVEHVPVIVNYLYFLLLNIGIVICCLLMMFFPTLILTRLTPVKTLRFD